MKQNKTDYWIYPVCIISSLAFMVGCASFIQNSPEPRFYALKTMGKNQAAAKLTIPPGILIGVGPVNVPENLNRPQIVTQNTDKTLAIAQFDRWSEPLDSALAHGISENLRVLLPSAVIQTYPWNAAIPVKYQVIMDVIRLVSDLKKNMTFVVQWSVVASKDNKVMLIKKSEFSEPIKADNYAGLVETLSLGCASLSNQIASGIATIANKPENKIPDAIKK